MVYGSKWFDMSSINHFAIIAEIISMIGSTKDIFVILLMQYLMHFWENFGIDHRSMQNNHICNLIYFLKFLYLIATENLFF